MKTDRTDLISERERNLNKQIEMTRPGQAEIAANPTPEKSMQQIKSATPPPTENLDDQLNALLARQDQIAADNKAESERIQSQKAEIYKVLHPFQVLLQRHRLLRDRISLAGKQRQNFSHRLVLLEAALESSIGELDNPVVELDFTSLARGPLAGLVDAEKISGWVDLWLSRKNAQLVDLEAEMRAYSAAHSLEYLLPADLAASK